MNLLKTQGVSGASVEKVMTGAGLTIGGFYAHFRSKDSLIAEALRYAFKRGRERTATLLVGVSRRKWIERYVRTYLAKTHRDQPELGCPMPAILSEVARCGPAVKQTLDAELHTWAANIGLHLPAEDDADGTSLAIISTCVGAMSLARALGDCELSDKILQSARSFILERVSE